MRKLWLFFGCIFTSILLSWCCSCPCSEETESMDKSEFVVTDFDSAMTAFYNWWSFTCDFLWNIEEKFMSGHIVVDENRLSFHANWRNEDSSEDLLTEEGYLFIKNWLLFEWSKEDGVEEWEVDEGWMEDIIEVLNHLREVVEDAKDWTWTAFNIDCKAWIKESDFMVPNGIYFDY